MKYVLAVFNPCNFSAQTQSLQSGYDYRLCCLMVKQDKI